MRDVAGAGRRRDRVRRPRPHPRRHHPRGHRRGDGQRAGGSTTPWPTSSATCSSPRGRRMADNNLRQALVPVGATIIPQTRGTAPGLICPVGDKVVYAVPGVPHEMQEMLERAVLPDLRRRSGDPSVIASRVLRTWGESESGLDERLRDVIARLDDRRQPDARLPGQRVGRAQGPPHGQGRHRCRSRRGVLLAAWEAEIRDAPRPARVRRRRRLDGVGGARPAAPAGADARAGRVGHRRSGGGPAHGRGGRQRRGARLDRELRQRREVRRARRAPGPGRHARGGGRDGGRAPRRVLGADVGLALTGVAGPAEQDGQPVGTLHVGLATRGWGGDGVAAAARHRGTRCASSP